MRKVFLIHQYTMAGVTMCGIKNSLICRTGFAIFFLSLFSFCIEEKEGFGKKEDGVPVAPVAKDALFQACSIHLPVQKNDTEAIALC